MKLRLHVSSLPAAEAEVVFATAVVRIGRNPESELPLQGSGNQAVSWNHARIELGPAGAYVSDLKSSNHTFVNDQEIETRTAVKVGDHIRLGQSGPTLKVLALELSGKERAGKPAAATKQRLSSGEAEVFARPGPVQRSFSTTRMMLSGLQKKQRKLVVSSAVVITTLLAAVGLLAYFQVVRPPPSPPVGLPPRERDLYVLSVGVSKYQNANYNLEYADKDAEEIVQAFKGQEGLVFKEVKSELLVNERARKRDILRKLEELPEKPTQHDLAIISLAGHGQKDRFDAFYYLPHDYDPENVLAVSAISWDDFRRPLAAMPCQVWVIMDTCHSGAVARSGLRGTQEELTTSVSKAVEQFARNEQGMVIMAACRSDGKAQENPDWGHGALTLALLEGINGDWIYKKKTKTKLPEASADGVVNLYELDQYITRRVNEVGGGAQAIVTKPTRNINLEYIPICKRKP